MIYRSPEQQRYAKLIEGALRPGPPLLAGASAGLGKTHGYSIPLVRSGKRIAIAMSTRQLMQQYLDSHALATALQGHTCTVRELQSRQHFETDKAYQTHRSEALQAQVLLVTHAAALIDSLQPGYAQLRERDVVLFDEADLLADAAELRSTFAINVEALKACQAQHLTPEQAAHKVRQLTTSTEDRCAASAILYALANPAPYKLVGHNDAGDLVLRHRMPGRMLKPLVKEVPRCIFTSGTLQVHGSFDHFVRAMGLTAMAPESCHIEPTQHGHLTVQATADALSLEQIALRIATAQKPTLVLTSSHRSSQELRALLPHAVVREADEPLADAVQRCPTDGVLIAAGAWSGLDEPRLRWRTVVIPQTPYGQPVQMNGISVNYFIDSQVVALRRTNQGLHRGLRTPDAQCTLLLLDPRSSRLTLRSAIPARFSVDWDGFEEGSLVLQTHFKRERNQQLKNAALKHYGNQCMFEGCEVTKAHWLEVHHTLPISEGERRTTLEDVQVLCSNHHKEAHHLLRMAAFSDEKSTESSMESTT